VSPLASQGRVQYSVVTLGFAAGCWQVSAMAQLVAAVARSHQVRLHCAHACIRQADLFACILTVCTIAPKICAHNARGAAGRYLTYWKWDLVKVTPLNSWRFNMDSGYIVHMPHYLVERTATPI